ncbi:MAG: hypothetical protein ACYSWS_07715 [Planctomycetota bacterium]|jgi:hypothetical protein
MVERMSSKERIHRMAEEAAACQELKLEKKKKTTTRKKATATTKRHKAVWKVFNDSYKEVACFPYSEKDEAYARADDLTRKKNNNYFVNEIKVPIED